MQPAELPLRDIHLPDAIGWWPVASGWWILLGLSVVLAAFVWWWWRRMKQFAAKRCALREFNALKENRCLTVQERIEQLSILLRRTSISIYPREQVAGLTGQAWLTFLDRQLKDDRFTKGEGKLIVEAAYRKEVNGDLNGLFKLCEDWVKALPRQQK